MWILGIITFAFLIILGLVLVKFTLVTQVIFLSIFLILGIIAMIYAGENLLLGFTGFVMLIGSGISAVVIIGKLTYRFLKG